MEYDVGSIQVKWLQLSEFKISNQKKRTKFPKCFV